MRRLEMAADAIRFFIASSMVLALGCHSGKSTVQLSARYEVCAQLPEDVFFRSRTLGPDFDLVTLEVDGMAVEVLIGGHPGFSQQVRKEALKATDRYRFLGKERSDGRDRILLGRERGNKDGPTFVVFSSPDLRSAEQVLKRKNLIVDCK